MRDEQMYLVRVGSAVMKNMAVAAGLLTLCIASTTVAKSPPASGTIEQLAIELPDAYVKKNLGRLDRKYSVRGKVKIEIEDSLAGDDNPRKPRTKEFQSLAQGEQWLKSIARSDFPVRESRPLIACKQGSCTYDFSAGILHNHLYLKKISYGYKNGRPYLKTIYLLDGN
jgi:hypothetical protein